MVSGPCYEPFGVNWAGNASSPTLTRIAMDSTNATYVSLGYPESGGAAFDSFTYNSAPWANMKRVNLWDDGAVTSTWGTQCYTDTDTDDRGQVMVQIPRFLFYIDLSYYASGKAYFYIADPCAANRGSVMQANGVYHALTDADTHPLFTVDGKNVDYAYISAFEGYVNDSGVMESKAGVAPTSIDTQTDARIAAEARGQGWELMNIDAYSALQLLYMVEYATLNSQAAIGNGITSAAGVANTGATGTTGTDRGNLTYGTTGNSTTAMSYRGVENLWGNMRTVVDGINIDSSNKIWGVTSPSRTRPTYAWSTYTSPYVNIYATALLNGGAGSYIKTIIPTDPHGSWFLPYTGGGSSSTYWCDETWEPTTGDLAVFPGGQYNDGAGAGIFAQRFLAADSAAGGARLQYLPEK